MGSRLFLLLSLSILSGCTRDLAFRVVDAETGDPIPDVKMSLDYSSWQPDAPGLLWSKFRFKDLDNAVMTDTEGMAQRSDVSPDRYVYFEKAGYCNATIDRRWPSIRIRQSGENRSETVRGEEVDGVIQVPLKRSDTSGSPWDETPQQQSLLHPADFIGASLAVRL